MKVTTIIIGAGPAGLAMAGRLRKAGMAFEIIEQSDKIAPKWHGHYDRLHLHTVKSLSSLPHLDFPADYPQYISKQLLVEYYEGYVAHFKIKIHFKTQVTSVARKERLWLISCANGKRFKAQNVIIATGLNRVPHVPKWIGQDRFKGEILHAADYKNPKKFMGKKVLVAGFGNTGAEIALDLAERKIEVGISVRSEIVVIPRDFMGKPVQYLAPKLAKLPFRIGDIIGLLARSISFGNLSKYGLPISSVHPTVFIQEQGKTPIIDLGTMARIKKGQIKVFREITEFQEQDIHFADAKTEKFDAVILATGYYANMYEFLENGRDILNHYGLPKHNIGNEADKGLHFIGFNKFTLEGLLHTLKADSLQILERIKQQA